MQISFISQYKRVYKNKFEQIWWWCACTERKTQTRFRKQLLKHHFIAFCPIEWIYKCIISNLASNIPFLMAFSGHFNHIIISQKRKYFATKTLSRSCRHVVACWINWKIFSIDESAIPLYIKRELYSKILWNC